MKISYVAPSCAKGNRPNRRSIGTIGKDSDVAFGDGGPVVLCLVLGRRRGRRWLPCSRFVFLRLFSPNLAYSLASEINKDPPIVEIRFTSSAIYSRYLLTQVVPWPWMFTESVNHFLSRSCPTDQSVFKGISTNCLHPHKQHRLQGSRKFTDYFLTARRTLKRTTRTNALFNPAYSPRMYAIPPYPKP